MVFVGVAMLTFANAGTVLTAATEEVMTPVSKSINFGAAVLPAKNSDALSAGSSDGASG